MRKGIRNFCNGDASTSTLDQHNKAHYTTTCTPHDDHHCFDVTPSAMSTSPNYIHMENNNNNNNNADTGVELSSPPTLEQMILQLELEEEFARKAKLNNVVYVDDHVGMRGAAAAAGRMSCVNNSDILRSARNALNQYPRFSLDGKDAMYRSSFRNLDSVIGKAAAAAGHGRKSVCCDHGVSARMNRNNFASKFERKLSLPSTLAGERVSWCKPGVIAKLMGLEAMPVPINNSENRETLASIIKRQNLRRRAQRYELERRLRAADMMSVLDNIGIKRSISRPSCSKPARPGYNCVMKPVAVEPAPNDGGGWPTRRFR